MTEPIEYHRDDRVILYQGDCREVLTSLVSDEDGWADAIITDPPYELKFMGKGWDGLGIAFDPETWKRCYDVLKPGGYLLAFGGPRTWHRMAVAIEDAGFELRDCIAWLYGSGFPKSLDVSKAIDKSAGAEREVTGLGKYSGRESSSDLGLMNDDAWQGGALRTATAPATYAAKQWQGWDHIEGHEFDAAGTRHTCGKPIQGFHCARPAYHDQEGVPCGPLTGKKLW